MLLRKIEEIEVDDARIEALTTEAFRLVLEARRWRPYEGGCWLAPPNCGAMCSFNEAWAASEPGTFFHLANIHHSGSTYDAFVEVERVQALLSAVEAAERGEWSRGLIVSAKVDGFYIMVSVYGAVLLGGLELSLWVGGGGCDADPARAAREARAQLPRLVRVICGLEG